MPDDLERRLPDVPAAFPRPDAAVTERVRRLIHEPPPRQRRLGIATALTICVAASVGFTAGHWLLPTKVQAATGVSIVARPPEITAYKDQVTFFGVAGNRSGEAVSVEAKECGSYGGFHAVLGAQTGSGGAWSTDPRFFFAGVTTTYRARWQNQLSDTVTVRVHPGLLLRKLNGFYELDVRASDIFRGELAAVQRLSGKRWITIKRIKIVSYSGYNLGGIAKFRLKAQRGALIRVVLSQSQVGSCFLPGISNIVRV